MSFPLSIYELYFLSNYIYNLFEKNYYNPTNKLSHQFVKLEIVREVEIVIEDDQSLKLTNKNELSKSIVSTC